MVLNKSISSALIFGNCLSSESHFRFDFFGDSKGLFDVCCLHATSAVITWLSADSEASVDASGCVLPCVFTCHFFNILPSSPRHASGCVCESKHWIRTRPRALWSWVCKLRLYYCSSFLPVSLPSIFCFFVVCFSRQRFLLCKISGNFIENMTSFSL